MTETQKEYLLKSVWGTMLALGPEVAPDKSEAEQTARAVAYALARLLKKPVVVRAVAAWAVQSLEAQDKPEGVPS